METPERPATPGRLARDIGGVLVHYISAQIRICLILTAVYAVGFVLLKVPLWPAMAVLCGFAHAVPMFGAVVAIVIAAALTWVARDGYSAAGVLGVFAAAQVLEGFWLTPRIMGRHLNLSPWWVFIGALVASLMFGFVGVLLAIPAMAVAAVVWRFVRSRGNPATPR
jgi:predicted PurR-regulated permease PerM